MRHFISLICLDAGALGHRADIVVSRTARTICAAREAAAVVAHGIGETERERPADALLVTPQDIIRAAELALAHRRRERTRRARRAATASPTAPASGSGRWSPSPGPAASR